MVGHTVYCNQLVLIRLNNACDVFVQLIFPFRLNEGNPVLNCKYELQIDLRIGIGHGYFVPHGTRENGWVISDSINILSLTGHSQESLMRFLQKHEPMRLLRPFAPRNDYKRAILSLPTNRAPSRVLDFCKRLIFYLTSPLIRFSVFITGFSPRPK